MAIPATPTNFYLQTANRQDYLSWDLMTGATSYQVQKSTDGVTFSLLASPATNAYLDLVVTVGTQYFYKVAATNADGTSSYTIAQSITPVPAGEESLGSIRLQAQQRADRQGSQFVTLPEWNKYINQSLFELYDLLIESYGEDYFAETWQFSTDGSESYPLPDGLRYDGIKPFYKLLGVDLSVPSSQNGLVTIGKYNFIDRNNYFYPNTAGTLYGVFNMRYRLVGDTLRFIPNPTSSQPIQAWYVPRMTMLLQDTDYTSEGISGWIEYVIVDAAIKALQKEESDTSALMVQKEALRMRIESASKNRDAGAPQTISDTRGVTGGRGGSGFQGGF